MNIVSNVINVVCEVLFSCPNVSLALLEFLVRREGR